MKQWRVSEVMTRDVVTANEDTTYEEIVDLLRRHRVSALPVVNHVGHVLGVVSETDLLRRLQDTGGARFGRRRRGQAKAGARTARDLMTSPPVQVMPSATVEVAARRMLAAGVKRLPVEDYLRRLTGIVTRGDLLRATVDVRSPRDDAADHAA